MKYINNKTKFLFFNQNNEKKMVELLEFLKNKNPYWKKYCNAFDINSSLPEILDNLPITSKEKIKKIGEEYFSIIDSEPIGELTSGSTGVPFKCFKMREERNMLALFLWNERLHHDANVTTDNFLPLLGKINMISGIDFANSSTDNMFKIIQYINSKQIRWLCGSKSILLGYADFLVREDIALPSVKYLELQGEQVCDYEREFLEKVFQAKTIIHYGTREFWTIAYECKCGQLHILTDEIICELIENEELQEELVLTSTALKYMPFLRYRTGDLVELKLLKQCECGKKDTLVIYLNKGRTTSLVVGEQGLNGDLLFKRVIHKAIKVNHSDDRSIEKYFVEQLHKRSFLFHIQQGENYSSDLEESISALTEEYIGGKCDIRFIYENISLSSNGKSKIFINSIIKGKEGIGNLKIN